MLWRENQRRDGLYGVVKDPVDEVRSESVREEDLPAEARFRYII